MALGLLSLTAYFLVTLRLKKKHQNLPPMTSTLDQRDTLVKVSLTCGLMAVGIAMDLICRREQGRSNVNGHGWQISGKETQPIRSLGSIWS